MASSMAPAFLASLRAVGTATTMAFVGFYMHRRGFVTPSGKKMLALLSQQVTIPAFLFAKIIYCPDKGNAGGDVDESTVCPSVADRIGDLKLLLVWPVYVVFCGIITGYFAARISNTPKIMTASCLAVCAFGNSTGLAITLLSVVHKQFKGSAAELGRIDPTTFLSIYLLLYPVLQWGVGGWLLAPEEKKEGCNNPVQNGIDATVKVSNVESQSNILSAQTDYPTEALTIPYRKHSRSKSLNIHHILNYEPPKQRYSAASAAGEEVFGVISVTRDDQLDKSHKDSSSSQALKMMVKELSFTSFDHFHFKGSLTSLQSCTPPPSQQDMLPRMENGNTNDDKSPIHEDTPLIVSSVSQEHIQSMQESDILPLTTTLLRISDRVFQAPVIASIAGLFIASFPSVRGLLVNIWGGNRKQAPLQWMFDGINSVGQTAVPINMAILGINLSSTFKKKSKEEEEKEKAKLLPSQTMFAVVIGKMVVMPILGIITTWFLQRYYFLFPDAIDATCYLVMMIVFITPTANNVMVMVELSGSSTKEGIARVIGYQYLVSPVILSVVLAVVVSLASCHFDASPVCAM